MELPGWSPLYSGKVRDLYAPAGDDTPADAILVVASDRVSAFDYALEPAIPGKGALLTGLSRWWFDRLAVPNHLLADEDVLLEALPEDVAPRAMAVVKLDMFPLECVVRGYLTGSGWKEYQEHGTVCGIELPAGLSDGDRLPAPLYTPAYKAPFGEHDENISFERSVELVGAEDAEALRALSLDIYARAAALAESRGVILADTKFEFGRNPATGAITLGDEVLTSDSSRYWDAAAYAAGGPNSERLASFDKQIIRNWLAENWDQQGTPPELPTDIVLRTAARYAELLDRLSK